MPYYSATDDAARTMLRALVAIRRMTNGSQPKDYPGALMVAEYAIREAEAAGIALEIDCPAKDGFGCRCGEHIDT